MSCNAGNDSKRHISLHGKIRPQVNVFTFDRLTGHETHVGGFMLYGQNQFCRGETH